MSADSTTARPLTPTPLPLKWTKKEREGRGKGEEERGRNEGRRVKGRRKKRDCKLNFLMLCQMLHAAISELRVYQSDAMCVRNCRQHF